MVDKKLKERLSRLMAMAKDASSEHEAAIAERRLHALLAKHNLSIDNIDDTAEKVHIAERHVNWPWKRVVSNSIAELYFCKYYHSQLHEKNYAIYNIVGDEVNVMVAKQIIDSALSLIQSLAKTESKEIHGKVVSSFCTSFHNAAACRIYERCNDLIEAAKSGTLEDEETGKNLPAMMSVYENAENQIDEWLNTKGIRLKHRSASMSQRDRDGASRGRAAGDKVSLNNSLHKQNAPRALK